MPFTTLPSAGAKLRAVTLGSAITEIRPLAGYATAATTVNNSVTLVNATGLAVVMVANARWKWDLMAQYTSTTTADIKFGWTYPTGATLDWGGIGYNTAEAFTGFGGQTEVSVPGLGGTGSGLHLFGWVVTGSTAGTLQVQFAQNTLTGVNTSVDIGTILILTRLA